MTAGLAFEGPQLGGRPQEGPHHHPQRQRDVDFAQRGRPFGLPQPDHDGPPGHQAPQRREAVSSGHPQRRRADGQALPPGRGGPQVLPDPRGPLRGAGLRVRGAPGGAPPRPPHHDAPQRQGTQPPRARPRADEKGQGVSLCRTGAHEVPRHRPLQRPDGRHRRGSERHPQLHGGFRPDDDQARPGKPEGRGHHGGHVQRDGTGCLREGNFPKGFSTWGLPSSTA